MDQVVDMLTVEVIVVSGLVVEVLVEEILYFFIVEHIINMLQELLQQVVEQAAEHPQHLEVLVATDLFKLCRLNNALYFGTIVIYKRR